MKKTLIICLTYLFLFSSGLQANNQQVKIPSKETLVKQIQKIYKNIQSFQTDFVQKLTNPQTQDTEIRKGKIAYKEPRLVYWETNSPEKELFVVTKECVWDYFPEEKVAYKYSLEKNFKSTTMLRLISGNIALDKDFSIKVCGLDQNNGWIKIKLLPNRPEPSLVEAFIWIEPEAQLMRQILLLNWSYKKNQLTFNNIDLNIELPDSKFDFSPPKNTQVIDNTGK